MGEGVVCLPYLNLPTHIPWLADWYITNFTMIDSQTSYSTIRILQVYAYHIQARSACDYREISVSLVKYDSKGTVNCVEIRVLFETSSPSRNRQGFAGQWKPALPEKPALPAIHAGDIASTGSWR